MLFKFLIGYSSTHDGVGVAVVVAAADLVVVVVVVFILYLKNSKW